MIDRGFKCKELVDQTKRRYGSCGVVGQKCSSDNECCDNYCKKTDAGKICTTKYICTDCIEVGGEYTNESQCCPYLFPDNTNGKKCLPDDPAILNGLSSVFKNIFRKLLVPLISEAHAAQPVTTSKSKSAKDISTDYKNCPSEKFKNVTDTTIDDYQKLADGVAASLNTLIRVEHFFWAFNFINNKLYSSSTSSTSSTSFSDTTALKLRTKHRVLAKMGDESFQLISNITDILKELYINYLFMKDCSSPASKESSVIDETKTVAGEAIAWVRLLKSLVVLNILTIEPNLNDKTQKSLSDELTRQGSHLSNAFSKAEELIKPCPTPKHLETISPDEEALCNVSKKYRSNLASIRNSLETISSKLVSKQVS
ncbi:MAG: hypothetical protein HQK53_09065, partial [Oligoflexia bacterium]|nr:hypothetical protein [Oligoflexia bacterium]